MLATERPERPEVTLRPAARPLFQWIGELRAPIEIAHVGPDGRVVVDMRQERFTGLDGKAVELAAVAETHAPCVELIRAWESLRIAVEARQREGAPEPAAARVARRP